MKRLKLTVAILAFSCVSMLADELPSTWKRVPVTPGKGKGESHAETGEGAHKSPQRINLPDVYYDVERMCLHVLSSDSSCMMDYIIRDENGGFVMSGTSTRAESQYYDVDLSALPLGSYVLTIGIGGYWYEMELTLD